MVDTVGEARLDREGPAAPPRDNGELRFDAPWQGRAFGMVMSLAESGVFDFEDFRTELIAAVADAGRREREQGEAFCYYACWLQALERVLAGRGLLDKAALASRVHEYTHRPHGHDHDHGPTTA